MATVTTHPSRAFTYDDLKGMPKDGYQREIIGGSLIVSAAPFGRHQRVATRLIATLVAVETPDTMVLCAPCDWRLPTGDSVQPDLLVIHRRDFQPDGPVPASAIPLLVVEVLSPSNADHDRLMKRALYETLRVPAYWMVDPGRPSLLALRLAADHYETEAEVVGEDGFVTDWPFPLRLTPADLGR